jgi:uncharacterized damage-inducible protein DinB
MRDLLIKYLRYNLWANQEFVNWLNTLPEEAIIEKAPSSFPSILETMLHIWDAQFGWHNRFKHLEFSKFPSDEFQGEWHDVCENVLQSSRDLLAFVEAQDAAWLDTMYSYKLVNGNPATSCAADMVLHVTQHSTFHRGQIVTLSHVLHMRQPIPKTDYIQYCRTLEARS